MSFLMLQPAGLPWRWLGLGHSEANCNEPAYLSIHSACWHYDDESMKPPQKNYVSWPKRTGPIIRIKQEKTSPGHAWDWAIGVAATGSWQNHPRVLWLHHLGMAGSLRSTKRPSILTRQVKRAHLWDGRDGMGWDGMGWMGMSKTWKLNMTPELSLHLSALYLHTV